MTLQIDLPVNFENEIKSVILTAIKQAVQDMQQHKEWMSLKEGAAYAGVAYNTFKTFRLKGLRICEINGVKRVSKSAIDIFLNEHSF